MSRTGFIQNELDLKLLVLYIMARAAAPITFLQLLDLALCDAGVDYFSLTEAVNHLVETEHLAQEGDLYSITDKGRRNSEICESSLPYSIRMRCDENLVRLNDVLKRAALRTRENRLVDGFGVFFAAENHAAARTAQRLMRRCRDDVGIRYGIRMQPGGDQARNMRHIHHQIGAALFGDLCEFGKINDAGIGACARHNQLGPVLHRQRTDGVIINPVRRIVYAVRYDMKIAAGHIDRAAMRQVPTLLEVHPQNRIAWFQKRKIYRLIGARAAVRLDIGVFSAEKLFGTINRQALHHVHTLTSAVVAFRRITFSILIRQHAAGSAEHGFADEIFRRDQLDVGLLPAEFRQDGFTDQLVLLYQVLHRFRNVVHIFPRITLNLALIHLYFKRNG